MRSALFDFFIGENNVRESIKNEIIRILNSKNIKSSFPGIGCNFGIPNVSKVNYSASDFITFERICEKRLVKYDPRIQKAQVRTISYKNEIMILSVKVFCNKDFVEEPLRFRIEL